MENKKFSHIMPIDIVATSTVMLIILLFILCKLGLYSQRDNKEVQDVRTSYAMISTRIDEIS